MILRFSERLAIDDDDNIVFGAHLGTGEHPTEAVMKINNTGQTLIATTGDPAPGGGRFAGFGAWPSTGAVDRVAFVAAIDDGPGPIGIFSWQSGTLSRLVVSGEKLANGGVLPPFALNPVTALGVNGGVTFATAADPEHGGGSQLYYFGPPWR
jgi:hypothetical protein